MTRTTEDITHAADQILALPEDEQAKVMDAYARQFRYSFDQLLSGHGIKMTFDEYAELMLQDNHRLATLHFQRLWGSSWRAACVA